METLNQSLQNVLVSYGSNASQEMKRKKSLVSWLLLMNKIFNDQYSYFTLTLFSPPFKFQKTNYSEIIMQVYCSFK